MNAVSKERYLNNDDIEFREGNIHQWAARNLSDFYLLTIVWNNAEKSCTTCYKLWLFPSIKMINLSTDYFAFH